MKQPLLPTFLYTLTGAIFIALSFCETKGPSYLGLAAGVLFLVAAVFEFCRTRKAANKS